jgi:predicted RNase H-like HicB family nuclease
MAVAIYPALVTGDLAQGYRAELVDFEGAHAGGEDPSALLRRARELLQALLQRLDQSGGEWPEPTPVEALSDRLRDASAALLLVDVQVEETPVRVNISIGEGLLRRLDAAAEAQNMTRSGYIAAAVRSQLSGESPGRGAAGPGLREELSEFGRRLNQALGPESAFTRAVADLDERALDGLRALREHFAGARRDKPE